MDNKIKIYFILPTLHAGGAERVISFVSQNLDKKKFSAVLVVIGFEKESKYEINKIPIIYLNKKRVLNSIFAVSRLFIKNKPDIVLSTISHLNGMIGTISIFFPKIKFIGRQASVAKAVSKVKASDGRKNNKKFSLHTIFTSFGIKKLDYIICQSMDMKNDFLETYTSFNDERVKVINNPLTKVVDLKNASKSNNPKKSFITIGRLSKTKGFARILKNLSKVTIPYTYTIIGEGDEKEAIFNLAKELNIFNKIEYIPYTDNVYKYLMESDMFLQGSYTEGFPNALLESCCVGTPVIAFNVPGGTKEIVENNVNGYLVDDYDNESYQNYLNEDRKWDANSVRDSVYKKFNKEKIIHDYENLFFKSLNKNQN